MAILRNLTAPSVRHDAQLLQEYSDRARRMAAAIYRLAHITTPVPPIHVRAVARGHWCDKRRRIVLPAWLWSGPRPTPPCFVKYYVAHELAHELVGRPGHDFAFQLTLWALAPDVWHYEAGYKPRHYSAAHAVIFGHSPR